MTQEEKAKAYDEALEKAKKLYEKGTITESIGYIFPELEKSEDEKIRKEIIGIIRNAYWTSNRDRFNKLVAWLEKQDNQKSQGKSALEAANEEKVDNANKVASAWNNGYSNGYIQAAEKAVGWLYQRQAVDLEVSDIDKFVKDFKKAMKGGKE